MFENQIKYYVNVKSHYLFRFIRFIIILLYLNAGTFMYELEEFIENIFYQFRFNHGKAAPFIILKSPIN